jgi:ferric-dicitrate binding protein FerR (iron transport regulator)
MKSDSAKNILQQYSGNDLGEIESSSLEQWMLDEEGFDKKSEAMQSVWDTIPKDARVEGLRSSKSVLSDAKMQEYGSSGKGRRLRLVAILSTAAAVASIIFSAALLYQRSQNEETICLVSSRDGKGDFTLPDGTLVWLNHGSRLTYKGDLQGKERRVTLEGEGYFDVYKDSAHPFVVSAGKMDVKVLGTKFTIFSGDERGTGVYLREGAVEALIPEIGSVSLSPDQALILDSETGVWSKKKVKASNHTSWIDDRLVFYNTSLFDIVENLEHWYSVDIVLDDEAAAKKVNLSMTVRSETIDDILLAIKSLTGSSFRYDGSSKKIDLFIKQHK